MWLWGSTPAASAVSTVFCGAATGGNEVSEVALWCIVVAMQCLQRLCGVIAVHAVHVVDMVYAVLRL